MQVFISIDMEGVAGVVHREQVRRGTDEYPACRELMEGEANAAIEGAYAGGADRVVVNDAHGDMRNLRAASLDPRAELLVGSPKLPFGMMQGISRESGVALFVGYHARASTSTAILDHSYAGGVILDIRVNGTSWGEAELNGAIAGAHGVPVGLVTGDATTCEQVQTSLGVSNTVVVKEAFGRSNALCRHPSWARDAIRTAAAEAVRAAAGGGLQPYRPAPPFHLEVDFVDTGMAELATLLPGSDRVAARTVAVDVGDVQALVQARMALTALAASAR